MPMTGFWRCKPLRPARIERQSEETLTMALCRQVITESDSTAKAHEVYFQVRQWQSGIARTRWLGRR
jgi:hypothetical protein